MLVYFSLRGRETEREGQRERERQGEREREQGKRLSAYKVRMHVTVFKHG